LSVAFRRETPT